MTAERLAHLLACAGYGADENERLAYLLARAVVKDLQAERPKARSAATAVIAKNDGASPQILQPLQQRGSRK